MPVNNDLISRSALLETLKEQHDYIMQDPEVSKTMAWCEAVCFRRTVEALESAPAVDAVPKWISVKDRLPERAGRYLCVKRIGKSGMVYVQLMNGDSYGFSMEHIYTDDVTHWMPLPEPPKEG